jgi:hypothetical protein
MPKTNYFFLPVSAIPARVYLPCPNKERPEEAALGSGGARGGCCTNGNRAFAMSKNLRREPSLGLQAKNSLPRVKKILGEDKNSR